MLRRIIFACALVLAFGAFSSAEALIKIPCTGSHFLKAPDVLTAKGSSGQDLALYYTVSGCSDGRWDGYRGSDGKYYPLNPSIVASLPPAPGFWTAAWQNKIKFLVEWVWIVIGAFVAILFLLSQLPVLTGMLPGVDATPQRRS